MRLKQTLQRTLLHKLTVSEFNEAAQELTQALDRIESLEAEKKSVMSDFKAQLDSAIQNVRQLTHLVRERKASRPTECEEWWDYNSKTIRVVRTDTREILSERPMTSDQLQMELDVHTEPSQASEQEKRDEDEAAAAPLGGPVSKEELTHELPPSDAGDPKTQESFPSAAGDPDAQSKAISPGAHDWPVRGQNKVFVPPPSLGGPEIG